MALTTCLVDAATARAVDDSTPCLFIYLLYQQPAVERLLLLLCSSGPHLGRLLLTSSSLLFVSPAVFTLAPHRISFREASISLLAIVGVFICLLYEQLGRMEFHSASASTLGVARKRRRI